MVVRIGLASALAAVGLSWTAAAAPATSGCAPRTFEAKTFIACAFDARHPGLTLFHADSRGAVIGDFSTLARAQKAKGRKLRFAMNGGMYHADRAPVGLYVEGGRQLRPIVTRRGQGNFSMLPNGVFYVDAKGAGVLETGTYLKRRLKATYATQSGPMLVIDGRLHPRFRANGPSHLRRNGVGLSGDGKTVWFAISDDPVNFHTFARFFRDGLGARNALYFDGNISRIYAPEIGRDEFGLPMGPIVGVVE